MRLADSQTGYGWISIVLHWTTAIIILVMWFVGNSLAVAEGVAQDKLIHGHTTIAILAYALLWLRVLWRVFKGHPGPLPKQRGVFYPIGVGVHLIMVAAIGAALHIGGVIKHAAFNRDGTFAKMMLAARKSGAAATG